MRKLLFIFLFLPFFSEAQTYVGRQLVDSFVIDAAGGLGRGLTWLPTTYGTDPTSQRYPLIIFLHGLGEAASPPNYTLLTATSLPQLIANGFNVEAVSPVDGLNKKFIVISPQHAWFSYGRDPAVIPYFLNSIIAKYRIDTTRIYVTGLSAGAQGSVSFVTNDTASTKRIAAIVPISFSGWNNTTEQSNTGLIGSKWNVKMWNITGANDQYKVNADNLNTYYNTATPAPPVASPYSVIANVGHDGGAWNLGYDPVLWKQNVANTVGKNIYEWMLLYSTASAPPPSPSGQVKITVTFATAPASATSNFTDLKYNKQGIYNFEMDDRSPDGLNVLAYFKGGVAPIDGLTYPGKTFTDGTGTLVKWRAGMAVNAKSNYNDTYWNDGTTRLTDAQMRKLDTAGWSIQNHGYYHNQGAAPDYYGVNKFNKSMNVIRNSSYIYDTIGGVYSRIFVVPNNDTGYHRIADSLGYLAGSSQSVSDTYTPIPPNTWNYNIANLASVGTTYGVYLRDFHDQWGVAAEDNSRKLYFDTLVSLSSTTAHRMYRLGSHGINNNMPAFKALMDYADTKFADKIWVAGLQEVLEYYEAKRTVVKTESLVGNVLTITLNYSGVPVNNKYRDLTLKINSATAISSIAVDSAAFSSSTSTAIVNVYKQKTSFAPPPVQPIGLTNVRIPLKVSDAYQDNNVAASVKNLIDDNPLTGFAPAAPGNTLIYEPHDVVFELYDYTPVTIKQLRMYDANGNGFNTKFIIVRADNGQEVEVYTFTGNAYNIEITYDIPVNLQFPASKLIIRNSLQDQYPTDLKIYGDYTPHPDVVYNRPRRKLSNYLGANLHPWDLTTSAGVDTAKYNILLSVNLQSLRTYDDGYAVEHKDSPYVWTFNPEKRGFRVDDAYQRLKVDRPTMVNWRVYQNQAFDVQKTWDRPNYDTMATGTVSQYTNYGTYSYVVVSLNTWIGSGTYSRWYLEYNGTPPAGQTAAQYSAVSDYTHTISAPGAPTTTFDFVTSGNLPYVVGTPLKMYSGQASHLNLYLADNYKRDSLMTWRKVAKAMFVETSRGGNNPNAPDYTVASPTGAPGEVVQTYFKGAGIYGIMEPMNEPNAFWKGYNGYLSGKRGLAQAWSMAYDGHKGAYPGYGAKLADSTMRMSTSGLASDQPDLYRAVVDWSRTYRGYKPDGTVNLPFDIIQYHSYSGGQYGGGQTGIAPEIGMWPQMRDMVAFSNKYAAGREVWIGEWGWDVHPGSNLKAPAYGVYNPEKVRDMWAIRTMLGMAETGIDRAQWYRLYQDYPATNSDNDATQFATMALLRENEGPVGVFSYRRTGVGDYFKQFSEFGDYTYDSKLNTGNDSVYAYKFVNGNNYFYAVWSLEQGAGTALTERTGNLIIPVPNNASLNIRRFVDDSSGLMSSQLVSASGMNYTVAYNSKPVFITCSTASVLWVGAGADQTTGGTTVTLIGNATPAAGQTITGYNWTLVSGPNSPTITTPTQSTTTVTGLVAGTYTFRLTATQSNAATVFDDVVVVVTSSGFYYFFRYPKFKRLRF